nr:unnamed protein product [Digitaria exilis]
MDGEEEAAEAVARIRLVRCPRCDKFLPELPAYSVYVCGGCGATLQAKKNSAQSSHDTDSGNVKYLEVLDCFPEASAAKPGGPSPSNLNMSVRDNGKEAKYRHIRDWENREMGQSSRIRDTSPRSPINGIPPHAYQGGLVDYQLMQRYRYSTREHLGERSLDGPSRVRGLEKDRAEILRMLDELRGQVQQSHDVTDRPRGSALTNKAADAPSSFANPDRYDYHAGFWGVMGRPCLGMIPPYIPEFNYPMPKNCGGGNTSVFVNGRELHQKDLDLLVTRGLSDSPGRSYVVENSGKVSDELSGEELYCLGKLAPT